MNIVEQYLAFIKEAEGLKSVLRTSWSSRGRPESTAEHSWRLVLLAALFLKEFPELDARKVLLTALIHDLGELYDGDISAALLPDENAKLDMERKAVHRLFGLLPAEDMISSSSCGKTITQPPPRKPGWSRHWTRRKPSSSTIRARILQISITPSI